MNSGSSYRMDLSEDVPIAHGDGKEMHAPTPMQVPDTMDPQKIKRCLQLSEQYQTELLRQLGSKVSEAQGLHDEVASLKAHVTHLEKELHLTQTAATTYCTQTREMRQHVASLEAQLADRQRELADGARQRELLQTNLEVVKERCADLLARQQRAQETFETNEGLSVRLKQHQNTISELERELFSLRDAHQRAQLEGSGFRQRLEEEWKDKVERELRNAELDSQLTQSRDETQRLRVEAERLREQLHQNSQAHLETLNRHLQTVEAKHRAHVEELHLELERKGRESALLHARYDKAVWTISIMEKERASQRSLIASEEPALQGQDQINAHTRALNEMLQAQRAKCADAQVKESEATLAKERTEMEIVRERRKLQADIDDLRVRNEELENSLALAKEEAEELRTTHTTQQTEISRLYAANQKLTLECVFLKNAKEREEVRLNSHTRLLEQEHQLHMETHEERIRSLEERIQRLTKAASERELELRSEVSKANSSHESIQYEHKKEVQHLTSRIQQLLSDLEEVSRRRHALEEETLLRISAHELLQKECGVLKDRATAASRQLAEFTSREQVWKGELQATSRKLRSCERKLDSVKRERDGAVRDLNALCKLLKSNMDEKNNRKTG